MKVNATYEGDLAVIAAGGELDANTAPMLRAAVDQALAQGACRLLFDLQGLDFIGSVGIGELIRAAKLLHERGGDLAVACCRPNVTRVFEISGTGALLHLHDEIGEARALLEQVAPRTTTAAGQEGEGHGHTQ